MGDEDTLDRELEQVAEPRAEVVRLRIRRRWSDPEAIACPLEELSDDQRLVRPDEERDLVLVRRACGERFHSCGKVAADLAVVTACDELGIATVPRRGQQDTHGLSHPLHVGIERAPELLLFAAWQERIDEDDGIRRFVVHAQNVLRPLVARLPLRVRREPVPQAGRELTDLHGCSVATMATRRTELTRQAARLFAEKGYHGTSIGDLAEAMGVQKGSLYAHIQSKQDLLYETMRDGAAAFHAALDAIPDNLRPVEKIRLALRAHLRVVADQLDVATVFIREWRYLEGDRRDEIVAERRRYEERFRALFREGRDLGELRTDLDEASATLLALSAANWAYTWLRPTYETDDLADRFFALLVDGIRGYATPS
jgi:TetR/AcrR family transcriptional regulator, cholesterol catabolism regulator